MMTTDRRPPVQPGERAPDFSLPAVHREGAVSLADYRGKNALLLAVFRGLYCPFCRRAIAELSAASDQLRAVGVEPLAVVATNVDNARLYFKIRPARIPLAADPECTIHRAYGLPQLPATPELMERIITMKVNPTGELPAPLPVLEAAEQLDRLHKFQRTDADHRDDEHQGWQLKGQFLVDRDGIVRWAHVESPTEGPGGFGTFPTVDELLAAARARA